MPPGVIFEAFRKLRAELWQSEQPTVPLFHYTDPAGLIGIIKNRELWASDVKCTNDEAELTYGQGLIQQALDELKGSHDERLIAAVRAGLTERDYEATTVFAASPRKATYSVNGERIRMTLKDTQFSCQLEPSAR